MSSQTFCYVNTCCINDLAVRGGGEANDSDVLNGGSYSIGAGARPIFVIMHYYSLDEAPFAFVCIGYVPFETCNDVESCTKNYSDY